MVLEGRRTGYLSSEQLSSLSLAVALILSSRWSLQDVVDITTTRCAHLIIIIIIIIIITSPRRAHTYNYGYMTNDYDD